MKSSPRLNLRGMDGLALPIRDPDPGDDGRERDDGERVDGLEPGIGEYEPAGSEEVAVDDLVGEEGEGAAGLLEEHPEEHVEGEDDQHRDGLVARHLALADAFDRAAAGEDDEQDAERPLQHAGAEREEEIDDRDREQRADRDIRHALQSGRLGGRRADAASWRRPK